MKKIFLCCLVSVLSLIIGCNANENNEIVSIRLAKNYNGNWASEAVSSSSNNTSNTRVKYTPKVAVLDTGCNLKNKNIIEAINTLSNSNDVSDTDNHGTCMVSKILELNKNISVIPIKIAENSTGITEDAFSTGIKKAIELKVDIINISIGAKTDYRSIKSAIKSAIGNNIIVVAAAGNFGGDLLYPAKYDKVISVMARDINNIDLSFNGKSINKKSFSAPGEHILCNDQYLTGTSIATTYITTAVSIILNTQGKIQLEKVVSILKESTIYPTKYSYGLINFKKLKNNLDKK